MSQLWKNWKLQRAGRQFDRSGMDSLAFKKPLRRPGARRTIGQTTYEKGCGWLGERAKGLSAQTKKLSSFMWGRLSEKGRRVAALAAGVLVAMTVVLAFAWSQVSIISTLNWSTDPWVVVDATQVRTLGLDLSGLSFEIVRGQVAGKLAGVGTLEEWTQSVTSSSLSPDVQTRALTKLMDCVHAHECPSQSQLSFEDAFAWGAEAEKWKKQDAEFLQAHHAQPLPRAQASAQKTGWNGASISIAVIWTLLGTQCVILFFWLLKKVVWESDAARQILQTQFFLLGCGLMLGQALTYVVILGIAIALQSTGWARNVLFFGPAFFLFESVFWWINGYLLEDHRAMWVSDASQDLVREQMRLGTYVVERQVLDKAIRRTPLKIAERSPDQNTMPVRLSPAGSPQATLQSQCEIRALARADVKRPSDDERDQEKRRPRRL